MIVKIIEDMNPKGSIMWINIVFRDDVAGAAICVDHMPSVERRGDYFRVNTGAEILRADEVYYYRRTDGLITERTVWTVEGAIDE